MLRSSEILGGYSPRMVRTKVFPYLANCCCLLYLWLIERSKSAGKVRKNIGKVEYIYDIYIYIYIYIERERERDR